jgi:hypothetical protein
MFGLSLLISAERDHFRMADDTGVIAWQLEEAT